MINLRENSILILLIAAVLFFAFRSDAFLTISNFRSMAINNVILVVVVVPSTMLVIAGYIDFAVGSTVGLTGVIAAVGVTAWGLPAPVAMIAAVLSGGLVGLV